MERIVDPHTARCERVPLRDVQNERSTLQQTLSSVKVCEMHTDQKENLCESSFIINSHPNLTFKSFTCAGGEVEISDRSLNYIAVTHQDAEGQHRDHPYCRYTAAAGTQEDHASSDHQGLNLTTFTSSSCSAGEVQIAAEESVVAETPDLKNETLSFIDGDSDKHTELPRRHSDHLYCNTQTSELRSENGKEEYDREDDGSDDDDDDDDDDDVDDDDSDYDGGGWSVKHVSIFISNIATDLTFKSFTCPGGEVEIADESLVKHDSLIPRDSEVQHLQSETSEEHTELPSCHFDHPYCNDETECSPVLVHGSATHSAMLVPNSLQGVTTKSDSFNTVNGSSAEERRDVTFQFSGAEVEIENTYRMSDMSTLMQGLKLHQQAESSPNSESSTHAGESVLIGEKDDHVYCHAEEITGSKSDVHLSIQSSSAGVSESSVKNEGSEKRRSEGTVRDRPPDPTVVQQPDLHQQTSDNLEENVLKDENTRLGCDVQDVFSDTNSKISHLQPDVDGIPATVSAETQNVQNNIVISQNANNANVSTDLEILRSESVDVEARMKMWSHIILSQPSTPKHSALWLPESPIPPPQLHSTILTTPLIPKPAPASDPALQKEKVMADFSAMGQGPLQDQLRKMGELLIAASGKFLTPAPATPVQQHSACVWTTPTPQQERSTNTSAIMEEKKEINVSDACTSTDSLLWSVSRSNLESLSRSELEQKMMSTLIMVEVLSQQLTLAQNLRGRTEPGPSSLRDRLVQTERTELSQTGPYRELYVSALERIQTLEMDQETFHGLQQAMQLMSNTLMSVKSEAQEALGSMKELEGIVTEDQEMHSQQLKQMKALFARCMNTLRKMDQKNKVCVKDRGDMKQQMEEALEKESTVLRVLEQLRAHHTIQVSDLQRNLGSHEELTDALTHTYPQLVELNRMHMDSVTQANTLLKETLEEHTRLSAELHTAQQLLQRTYPLLHTLQQRASAALEQSHTHQEERDRAVEDREQMEQQLYDTHSGLQEAHQQIADLKTQITIMSSEMAVLREQLTEVEDERSQLQRKTTELSATVSSSLASYAFLEQTLSSQSNRLQCSLHNTQEATERADGLQAALCVCEKRVEELELMMVQRDNLISDLGSEIENQRLQLRRLTQVQSELCNTKEMSEFLQAENELNREQLCESEVLLRSHLQGLRERNLQCEDLRVELQQLRVEKECVEQELVSTRDKARLMLLDQGEQLAQATLDTSLLLQRVCAVINHMHTCVSSDGTAQTDPSPLPQSCSSFLNSVINALAEEQPCVTAPPTSPEICVEEEDQIETMGSKSSAFTRITPAELENTTGDDGDNGGTTLLKLLSSLGESVSELQSAIERLKQHKDSEIHTLHASIRDLQEELEVQSNRHTAEGAELKLHLTRLKGQLEKDAQVLQQKTQDEKALRKLCSELEEKMETAQKHRAENKELHREGADLRRALQQSEVEVHVLRVELKSTSQSESSTRDLEDRIRLLREVEKLKSNLMEVEESRSKLLERAKRHQMVHAMNQSKLERELHLLDDMIETVRKALSSVPDVLSSCPELQKLLEYLG